MSLHGLEIFANLPTGADPRSFARDAEDAGFDGIACSDHYWLSGPFPHLWASLAAMATVTERVTVVPSFANNLLRSPFEFAQASTTLWRLADGRYEAGLGAGWTEAELARELFTTGGCSFQGEYYTFDTPPLPTFAEPTMPLVASVGGPWTIRNVTPLVDRVELKFGRTTRGGQLDVAALASVTLDELASMVASVRDVRPDIDIGLFLMVAAGTGPVVGAVGQRFGTNLIGRFVGEPKRVLDNLAVLADVGINRVQLTELAPGSLERLGEALG